MAKAKVTREYPRQITLSLHGPGMSPLHRAGLGGLACSLQYIQQEYGRAIQPQDAPGGPWPAADCPPWRVEPAQVTLSWGEPTSAREFLRRLFAISLDLRDGLIYLPGQYGRLPPPLEVRAKLQQGLTLTFLQHGRVRKLAAQASVFTYDPESDGVASATIEYRACTGYTYQEGWTDLTDGKGNLRLEPIEVAGPLSPGAVVRHNAFPADTKIEELPQTLLPLYFACIGCLALPAGSSRGALVVPEVEDLLNFAAIRNLLTPRHIRECCVSSAGDAALQAQIRLRALGTAAVLRASGCYAATFAATQWASQQKSRVQSCHVPAVEDRQLDLFAAALQLLPPRLAKRKDKGKSKGKNAKASSKPADYFWADSIVRPLVAENLAQGRPWYAGFGDLMTAKDPSNNKPLRDRVSYERKGLHAMTAEIPWEHRGEAILVQAVHEAMRCRKGAIAAENQGNLAAMRKRWERDDERLRLGLVGAKTADQCRQALCGLFGRAGTNKALQQGWQQLLSMLSDQRWQLARDLSLLAMASYQGSGNDHADQDPTNNQ